MVCRKGGAPPPLSPREAPGPIHPQEQHERGQHGELEGDPGRRAEGVAEHRPEAVGCDARRGHV
ncbi:MAG: hypothetical protein ABW228_08575 [Thermoleophilaceae bacterium]